MQNIFDEVASLDKRCYDEFALSEDLLMEHAAEGMACYIREHFEKYTKVLIVCGSGNNGADGIACARLLHGDYDVSLFYVKELRSPMAKLQQKRARALGVQETHKVLQCDVVIDAVVGTGFEGEFNETLSSVMQEINALQAFKIACDVPSGLRANGQCAKHTFCADISLSMGALKKSMFLDEAKEYVGTIRVVDLGISRSVYEKPSSWQLLEFDDLKLPNREQKNSHKGVYGHLAIASGSKAGASVMSAQAALRFGTGLVTLVGYENEQIPYEIMYSHKLPQTTTALAIGMGLGDEFSDAEMKNFLDNDFPIVVDADMFQKPLIKDLLKRKHLVLTPHPKEFVLLLKHTDLADISVEELQKNRFCYVELFSKSFPEVVLLLKGANVIIAYQEKFYINPHGTSVLAKGGSGDVLSGLIGALLAQGHSALEAAKNASLTHTLLARNYKGANFSLTPIDLINEISEL